MGVGIRFSGALCLFVPSAPAFSPPLLLLFAHGKEGSSAMDYATHPNLLVYWTGSDIDDKYHPEWRDRNSSETDPEHVVEQERVYAPTSTCPPMQRQQEQRKRQAAVELEKRYLDRLRSILKNGLWMTHPTEPEVSELTCRLGLGVPSCGVARVCFTELRLSHARTHAKQYGRLGIGVKPPFVLDRGGRPVLYYGNKGQGKRDAFLQWCYGFPRKERDAHLAHFLKQMRGKQVRGYNKGAPYEFYEESEWRIVYTDTDNAVHAAARGCPSSKEVCHGCVVSPRPGEAYLAGLPSEERAKAHLDLQYLLPLDGWLSCIIYPSVSLKRQALEDDKIRCEIRRIKHDPNCRANKCEVERGNWPVEIDLDLCRNL